MASIPQALDTPVSPPSAWERFKTAMTPTPEFSQQAQKIFDFRINLVSLIALGTMIFGAALGVSKYETREDHNADMRQIQVDYVRQDVNRVSEQRLQEWQESIKLLLKEHIESLDRIERNMDARDLRNNPRRP